MKRMICVTLTVLMLLALVSCGDVEYKVYYSGAATKDEGDAGIKVYDVENLHLDNDRELKPPIENTKAPQTKTLTIGKMNLPFPTQEPHSM